MMHAQQTQYSLDALTPFVKNELRSIFSQYLNNIPSKELKQAMAYTMENGGKQMRPLLLYATGIMLDAPCEHLVIPASAIELIHTYSLIHDDLPCMDDADLRRGKPTCHKVFGEALAVLAGDALQTLAIQILTDHPAPSLNTERRLQMVSVLTKAAGPYGMAAGQTLDMNDPSSHDLEMTYLLKTGALFDATLELAWLCSPDENEMTKKKLLQFSKDLSLAFQIQDDIFDVETSTEILGKTAQLDSKNKKMTYVHQHGLEAAKNRVELLYKKAMSILHSFDNKAVLLHELSEHLLKRKY